MTVRGASWTVYKAKSGWRDRVAWIDHPGDGAPAAQEQTLLARTLLRAN
jgi:hypothetical protein